MTLALYHNDMSSCAQKVRLMLAEKGLEWESRHLDLRAGEHQKEWYVKLNPRAVVPSEQLFGEHLARRAAGHHPAVGQQHHPVGVLAGQ